MQYKNPFVQIMWATTRENQQYLACVPSEEGFCSFIRAFAVRMKKS